MRILEMAKAIRLFLMRKALNAWLAVLIWRYRRQARLEGWTEERIEAELDNCERTAHENVVTRRRWRAHREAAG